MIGEGPSQHVIREHLGQVKDRTAGPAWDRGTQSLELLLGLRDRDIDEELLKLVPTRPVDDFGIGRSLLLESASDPTIHRIELLLAKRVSSLPLAWLTATRQEVIALAATLVPRLRTPNADGLWNKSIFAALCELATAAEANATLSDLRNLAHDEWLKNLYLAQADGAPLPPVSYFDSPFPPWHRAFPAALVRDGLTGALSRAALFEDPHRYGLFPPTWASLPTYGLLYVDVDRMKRVCDHYGLPAGDAVLVTLADHLQRLFGDRVIRFGGEEFLVACEKQNLSELAQHVVDSVPALSVTVPYAPAEALNFTVSIGVALGSLDEKTICAAEDAVQIAKKAVRNRIAVNVD